MKKRMTVAMNMEYMRTWSSYHGWQETHPDKKAKSAGGEGDVVDKLFEQIKETEPEWKGQGHWLGKQLDIEWGTALMLARKKE